METKVTDAFSHDRMSSNFLANSDQPYNNYLSMTATELGKKIYLD